MGSTQSQQLFHRGIKGSLSIITSGPYIQIGLHLIREDEDRLELLMETYRYFSFISTSKLVKLCVCTYLCEHVGFKSGLSQSRLWKVKLPTWGLNCVCFHVGTQWSKGLNAETECFVSNVCVQQYFRQQAAAVRQCGHPGIKRFAREGVNNVEQSRTRNYQIAILLKPLTKPWCSLV